MKLKQIKLEKFKKIEDVLINLKKINVLIGSNNSGKSSVLQGIHFSIVAAVAARNLGRKTFTQENLLYCPTRNFVTLRNGLDYQNQSNFSFLRLTTQIGDEDEEYEIRVYRGRNEGNVGCDRIGDVSFGNVITKQIPPFSIYVPGLAGIPQSEEYRSEGVVRKGVASGDANLYLRNVIYLIRQKKLLPELKKMMERVFPKFRISVRFNKTHDTFLDILTKQEGYGVEKNIELQGTGVLQALQIFSYVTLFKPSLLLLDEPDSHLHPDNQTLLSEALIAISEETNTKIIISTHSRHLVDSLYGEANFVWLKNGAVFEQGESLSRLSLLMDIGALDSFEKLREGEIDYVFLTEDSNMKLIKRLAKYSGFDLNDVLFYSYKASGNLYSAGALTEFLKDIAPNTKVIIHADNDFLTQEEETQLKEKIEGFGALPFITEGSDIESYFINSAHLATLLDEEYDDITEWLDEIAIEYHNQLTHKFSRKRDEAKKKLYKNGDNIPNTIDLMGDDIPLGENKRLGKFMLKKVRSLMHDKFDKTVDVLSETDYLYSDILMEIVDDE